MKKILQMAFKDLRLLSRDKIGLLFMLGFPIGMGIMFGMIGGSMSDGQANAIEIVVADLDGSEISKMFVNGLSSNENLDVLQDNLETGRNLVRKGNKVALVIVPEKFGETAGVFWSDEQPEIELLRDPSRAAEAGMVQGFIMEAAGQLMGKRFQDPTSYRPMLQQTMDDIENSSDTPPLMKPALSSMLGILDQFFQSLDDVQKVEEKQEESGSNEDQSGFQFQLAKVKVDSINKDPTERESLMEKVNSGWDISFPSAMMWGVLGCVAGFAISLVRERTHGTLVRLRAAPISRWQILGGKALACFLAVIVVVVFMTILGVLLGMRPKNYPLLALAAVCIGTCFVGIMMSMSVIGKTEEAVGGAGWGINILMAMFGGGMIPLAFMPDFFAKLSNYSPVKWGVLSLEGAIWREFTLAEMLIPCGILVGIGVVGFLVGVGLMRKFET